MQPMRNVRKFGKKVDPAPSRVSYILQRFWLRRNIRLTLSATLFAFTLGFGIYLLEDKKHILSQLAKRIDNVQQLLELSTAFKIEGIKVISDDQISVEKISKVLDLEFPINSLKINVEELKTKLENISFIHSASVRITSAGFVEIMVTSRTPVIIHRVGMRYALLDIEGKVVEEILSRKDRQELPLIIGSGAEKFVQEALLLLIESKDLVTRIRGLVRVGERRWDIILDRNQKINLPEKNPLKAIKKIVLLNEVQKIFARDISYLDFRDINRPILGLTESSARELRNLRNLVAEENV